MILYIDIRFISLWKCLFCIVVVFSENASYDDAKQDNVECTKFQMLTLLLEIPFGFELFILRIAEMNM